MAAKLKSIIGRIHWSLLARGFAFGLGWLLLPAWLFFALAIGLYLIPFFRPYKLAFPFLLVLIYALRSPASFWIAVFLGGTLYCLLGIKDLVFIDRTAAYEILTFLIVFLYIFGFFGAFGSWNSGGFLAAFGLSSLSFLLLRGLFGYTEHEFAEAGEPLKHPTLVAGIMSLLFFEALVAGLFLPLAPFYQAAFAFLIAFIGIDICLLFVRRTLAPKNLLVNFTIFFVVFSALVGSASWGL